VRGHQQDPDHRGHDAERTGGLAVPSTTHSLVQAERKSRKT
jgi:hypothetical protein